MSNYQQQPRKRSQRPRVQPMRPAQQRGQYNRHSDLAVKKKPSKGSIAITVVAVLVVLWVIGSIGNALGCSTESETPYLDERVKNDADLQAAIGVMSSLMEADSSLDSVCDAFYGIEPASLQSDVFAKAIQGKTVTWTGIVVEAEENISAVSTTHFDPSVEWSYTGSMAPYAFSTRGLDASAHAINIGDTVTVTGTVESRGANLDGAMYSWRIEGCQL